MNLLSGNPSSRLQLAVAVSLLLGICGCAGVAVEAIEADEMASVATTVARAAPALAESASGVAAESAEFGDLLGTDQMPRELLFSDEGETPGLYVNGKHLYDINMGEGTITDTKGNEVARIEGNRIFGTYPAGSRQLLAEIETRLGEPVTAYTDPTALTRIRILKTGDLVQVVKADRGWYQLRYVDEGGAEVLLWAFAPVLLSRVERNDNGQSPPILYTTHVPARVVTASVLESTGKLRGDIDRLLSSN